MSNLEKVLIQTTKKAEQSLHYKGKIGDDDDDDILLKCTRESLLIEISNKRKLFVLRAILNPDQISELTKQNLTTPDKLFKALNAVLTSKSSTSTSKIELNSDESKLIYKTIIYDEPAEIIIPLDKIKCDIEKMYENLFVRQEEHAKLLESSKREFEVQLTTIKKEIDTVKLSQEQFLQNQFNEFKEELEQEFNVFKEEHDEQLKKISNQNEKLKEFISQEISQQKKENREELKKTIGLFVEIRKSVEEPKRGTEKSITEMQDSNLKTENAVVELKKSV